MSLANKLTLSRVFMVPVMLLFLYMKGSASPWIAAAVFGIAALTDIVDGAVARRQNTVSVFGKVMDPIADKLLVVSALIPLVQLGMVHSLFVIVIVGREFVISGLRILASSRSSDVIPASWLGKAKTISQDIAIVLLIMKNALPFLKTIYLPTMAIWVAMVFTVWSTVDYLLTYRTVFTDESMQGGKA